MRLEQDLSAADQDEDGEKKEKTKTKRDVSRLLKIALDVEMSDQQIGDVGKVYTELWTVLCNKKKPPKSDLGSSPEGFHNRILKEIGCKDFKIQFMKGFF